MKYKLKSVKLKRIELTVRSSVDIANENKMIIQLGRINQEIELADDADND
jgi:hypothetical protein